MKKRILIIILILCIFIISSCTRIPENLFSPKTHETSSKQVPIEKTYEENQVIKDKQTTPKIIVENKDGIITSFSYSNINKITSSVEQYEKDTNRINGKIKEKGLLWTAGENKFTGKPEEELKRYLGLEINWDEVENKREEAKNFKGQRYDLPDYFDWKDQHGEDYITPIKDQEQCGSCWAFGTLAAVEGEANAYYNNPNLDQNLSEQDLVSCFHGQGCNGLYTSEFPNLLNYLINPKVCQETCFPYTATNNDCNNKCSNWQTNSFGINSWQEVQFVRDEIKNALITKGPLITGMEVYCDFFSYGGGIYFHTTNCFAGYHAVSIVGYGQEDGLEYWIVKNSWGENWGEDGYFRILMGESGIDSLFMYTINSPNPTIPQQKLCNDNDHDNYCNWGLGNKPTNCPPCNNLIKDCDDSNPNIFENCGMLGIGLGTLEVTSFPSDAKIYVKNVETGDYIYRGDTPLTFNLNPGLRTIKISKYEYDDIITDINIIENQTTELEVNLTLAPMLYFPDNNDIFRLGDPIRIIGTVPENADSFSIFYQKDYGEWLTNGIQLVNNGTGFILNDTVATWYTSVETEAGFYSIKLETYHGTEQSQTFIYDIYLDPTLKEGWPVRLDFYYDSSGGYYYWAGFLEPVVVDINNDNIEEIIVYKGGVPPKLFVYEPDGSLLWSKDIGTTQEVAGGNLHIPIVGYINNSENPKIIVHLPDFSNEKAYLYVLNGDGSFFGNFPVEIPFDFHPTIALKDLNLDDNEEIIIKGNDMYLNEKMTIVNIEGQIISSWNQTDKSWSGSIESSPAFGNFDEDPELEIVVARPAESAGGIWENDTLVDIDNTGEVSIYNLDGSLLPGWPINICGIIFSSPAVGDINNDGDLEIVFGTMYATMDGSINYSCGGLYALDKRGNILQGWPFEKGQEFWSSPSLADFNGDNYLEIGVSKLGFPPKTFILNYDGSMVDGWPEYTSWFSYYSTIIGDITGDHIPDLLTTAGSGAESAYYSGGGGVYAFNFSGNSIPGFPKFTEVDAQAPATISDIDNDGKLEVIASSDWDFDIAENEDKYRGTIYVWELDSNLNQETMHWPRFHHDTENTGLYSSPLQQGIYSFTSTGINRNKLANSKLEVDSGINYNYLFNIISQHDTTANNNYPDGWQPISHGTIDQGLAGKSIKVGCTNCNVNNRKGWSLQRQKAIPNKYYKLSGYIKSNTPSNIFGDIRLEGLNENSQWTCGSLSNVSTKRVNGTTNWTFVETNWVTTTRQDCTIAALCYHNPENKVISGNSSVWCDNLMLIESNTPNNNEPLNEYTICDVNNANIGDPMIITYGDGNNVYQWRTTIEQGRGLCDKNMLIITQENFDGTNSIDIPPISFYNQDHLDTYFTITYDDSVGVECEATLATCGEVFSPDCNSFGQIICCGDNQGEYPINGKCCNAPTDTINANGNCISKPKKQIQAVEIPLNSPDTNIMSQLVNFFKSLFK